MTRTRLSALLSLAVLPLCFQACKDSTGNTVTITCNALDPICPPGNLAAGFTGSAGAPTITPTSGNTNITVTTTAFSTTGATSATSNGYWLLVTNGVLRAWGVLVVSGGSFSGEVPLFCGAQEVVLSFASGNNRSYYRTNVTVTGCTTPAFRVQLTWDTGPSSDMDLHLLRPGGSMDTNNDCYYGNCQGTPLEWGATGPAGNPVLDVDDTQGWGPENIYITSGAEAGEYRVVIHNYDDTPATSATVKVFFNDVEIRRWTSLTLDAASNRRYWEVAKVNIGTGLVTTVNTYSLSAPVIAGVAAAPQAVK